MKRLIAFLVFLLAPIPVAAQLPMNVPDLCSGSVDNVGVGVSVTLSGTKGCIGIHGTVTVTGALSANTIIVYDDGFLDVQSGGSITFRDTAINTSTDPRQWGQGLIVFGRVRMIGGEKTPARRVTTDVTAGQSTVTVSPAPSGWLVGDQVFIPDTRQVDINNWFNPNYALRHEIRTISAINSGTITLSSPLAFDHRGARNANGTLNTAFLPHVANLTRSITVSSANPNGTRAHTAYMERANVEIRNTAFRDMGRTTVAAVFDQDNSPNQIGRYPVHFHMLRGPVNIPNTGYQYQFTGNVVRDSRKWPVAIHNTHYGLVENNVVVGGSQLTGSGIATESGAETENMIRGNFVGDIRGHENPRNTGTGTPSDGLHPGTGGECFWSAGVNNRYVNNIATGCRNSFQNIVAGVGWKFFMNAPPNATFVQNPTVRGASDAQMVSVLGQNQHLLEFSGNEAYGLMADGITIWHMGTDGYQWNPTQTESVILNMKIWHAYESGVWLYPTNKVTISGLSYRYDPSATPYCPSAFMGGDYRQVNLKITGGDIHACTINGETIDPVGTWIFQNVTATTRSHAVVFQTPATPGTQASRPAMGVTATVSNMAITAWPGFPLRTIAMSHRTDKQPAWTTQPYIVNVTEGVSTFRVCFEEQLTQALYGGICTGSPSRPDIDGIVSGTAPPTPPDPPDPPVPPTPEPPAEICGDGIDNDIDGSIDEGCPVIPPPPPVEDVPTVPTGPITLPTLQISGTDVSLSGTERTWNATSPTGYAFPFNPQQATYGYTAPFINTPSGTYAIAFRADATRLAALGQASSIGILTFRPEPDINIQAYAVRSLEIYRGDPAQNPMIRASEGRDNTIVYATTGLMGTLTSTTTAIVTWTPTNFSLWVNGVFIETRTRTPSTAANVRMMLAVMPSLIHSQDQQFLRGVTRDPVVYSRVITNAEVATLHAALAAGTPAPPPPPPPPPPPCTLTVSPTSVSWSVQQGQVPQATTITVSTSCGIPWSTADVAAFFDTTAACAFGTCTSPGTTTLTPSATFFAGASVGTVTGSLQVLASGATTVTIPVTVTITAVPPPPPPLDTDRDGVPDSTDRCANTPLGTAVDAFGCPIVVPPPPTPAVTITAVPTAVFWSTQQGQTPNPSIVTVSTSNGQPWYVVASSPTYTASGCTQLVPCQSGTSVTLTPNSAFFASEAAGTYTYPLSVRSANAPNVSVPVTATITAVPPPPPPAAVDCAVSDWSEWSEWTAWISNGDGTESRTRTRTRTVLTAPANGGAACPSLTERQEETRPIFVPPSPSTVPSPTVTLRSCSVVLTAERPAAATGSNWRIQYFSASTSLGRASTNVTQTVTLRPGLNLLTVRWSRSSSPVLISEATVYTCGQ